MSSSDDPFSVTQADESVPTLRTSSRSNSPTGYQLGELLGQGGMGEVLLATDSHMGRSVAIKRMRGAASPQLTARFLREAKIQAKLDHPSIVPVHELGEDAEGRPYFTMKRISGTTLAALLGKSEPVQRLLRAFVDVCLAVELAHSRGVVHRDLKPANVMLGDFGEVYVLDWGVARMIGGAEPDIDRLSVPNLDGNTELGSLLGTPGYMAPEQARGEHVSVRADIYSLGCILFEILTGEPLHARGVEALGSTLTTPTVLPSSRGRDVPPELDALCGRALAELSEHRPTARELADSVQRYLDGDRDLEQRKSLAAEELARARQLLGAGDRGAAMQAAGRALALDPHSQAAHLVSSLMLEPPRPMPAELQQHLAAVDRQASRAQWRLVSLSSSALFGFMPLMWWMGVKQPWLFAITFGTFGCTVAVAAYWHRRGTPRVALWGIVVAISMVLFSRFLGVLVFLPALLSVQLYGYLAYPAMMRRPLIPIFLVLSSFGVPIILELTRVLTRTWEVGEGVIVMRSDALHLGGDRTAVVLIFAHVTVLLVTGLFGWSLAKSRHAAQEAVEIQAWHLRKLLPAS